ncbi:hypothetical protein F2P56_027194 [Juglans regia]|uniref:RanBP2-type domain-containing protein n=2 Tax=Juglans regia TaxID=51240 RepID=A0A833U390_JUGRE|nr:rhomboid-like protein 14, mitochondrial isoform X2 [Juglans regia]KAF5452164.1 hypothetical protein F2P56_027194 [Juglans regia]
MERGRGRMLPLLAFHAASEYYRLDRKPPVTACLLAANTVIYLRPGFLHSILPPIDEVWFNAHLILKHRDLKRFFLSAFYHVGESHLVYNMMSLLWKGIQLETSMGSAEFASMVTALLVVLNSQSENYSYVHGVVVPARYAAWAELILIQMFVPGVSFLGHLGGILAGLLYLRLKSRYSGSDPLTLIFRGLAGALSWPVRIVKGLFRSPRRRISGRGNVGRDRTGRTASDRWRCQTCTYDNSGWLSICEMCGANRNDNGFSPHQVSNHSRDLPVDELRRRRMERFGR